MPDLTFREELPRLGFGCGGYWGFPRFPESEASALVQRAVELGVRFLDTGPSYSHGEAETRLGRILKNGGLAVEPLVATKVGSEWTRGRIQRDLSHRAIERSADASRRALGRDTLDLIQLHTRHPDELTNEALDALVSLKQRGVTRFIGVSGNDAVAARALSLDPLDCIMVTYNVLHRSSIGILTDAKANGLAVIVKSPLAHAVYTPGFFRSTSFKQLWYIARVIKNHHRDLPRVRRLRRLNQLSEWTPTQAALRFVLENDAVSSAVIGTTSVCHLEDAVAAESRPMDPEFAELLSTL